MLLPKSTRFGFQLLLLLAALLSGGFVLKRLIFGVQASGSLKVPRWVQLGDVEPNASIPIRVNFSNVGTHELEILRVATSCGCVVAKLPKKSFMPGEHGTLRLQYHSGGGAGRPVKIEALFFTNDPVESQVGIVLVGRLKPAMIASPQAVDFGAVASGSTSFARIILATPNVDDPFDVIHVSNNVHGLAVTAQKGRPQGWPATLSGAAVTLDIAFCAPDHIGRLHGKVVVNTTSPLTRQIEIPVWASVVSTFRATPSVLVWSVPHDPDKVIRPDLVLRIRHPKNTLIVPLRDDVVKCVREPSGTASESLFKCHLTTAPSHSTEGKIRFRCIGGSTPLFQVPYSIVRLPPTTTKDLDGRSLGDASG